MTDRNANRPGYKQTKVGWIPEEWEVKTLNHIGQIYTGGTPSTTNPEYWDGDINWIIPSEVTQIEGPFLYSSERKITEKGLKNSSAKVVPENSIIVCTRATIGNCVINKVPIATNQGFKSLSPYEIHDVKFIYYSIVNNKNNLLRLGAGSTFLEVSRRDFERIKLAIPPLSEQQKIAEILSTWDRAIEQTRQLIEAKRRLKKGLMQQLLTGRMRFPGFGPPVKKKGELPEGWEKKRIKNVIEINYGKSPRDILNNIGEIPVVGTSEEIRYGTKALTKLETIVIGRKGSIDNISFYEEPIWVIDTAFYTNEYKGVSPRFLYYLLDFIRLERYNESTGVPSLSVRTLNKIMVRLPSLEEQEKIKEIIRLIDQIISQHEELIKAYQNEKRGLMQKLLSGKLII